MLHRGPDGQGYHVGEGVALGMRRLAIVDVAHGDQPVRDESGRICAVFNGEIYNHDELRSGLPGHRFDSAADTECIPHLFEELGPEYPRLLNGMFAVALWDQASRSLHLCVDQLGKKPLYYTTYRGVFYFASELQALLAGSGMPASADPAAIGQYLTYRYVPAPASAVAGVHRVPPGHRLSLIDGVVRVEPYWRLRPHQVNQTDLEQEFRSRLLEATRIRLMGERPLGAFLSGGLDSSAVVAAMTRVSRSRVKTFSVEFPGDSRSERAVAARIAGYLGTEHHELAVDADLVDLLPMLVRHVGEPLADPSLIPTYAVSAAARQHIVVALSGDGGDESWGGYPHYLRAHRLLDRTIPTSTGRAAARALGTAVARRGPLRGAVERGISSALLSAGQQDPGLRYARFMSVFRPEDWPMLVRPEYRAAMAEQCPFEYLAGVFDQTSGDLASRMMMTDVRSYLAGDLLVKVDVASMACSLEVRSPLLDHTMIEWAASITAERKLRGGQTKAILREAVRDWLPAGVVDLPKKGFGVPLESWLTGPLRPMVGDLLRGPDARVKQFLVPGTVDRLADDPGPRGSVRLWTLLVLEIFLRQLEPS